VELTGFVKTFDVWKNLERFLSANSSANIRKTSANFRKRAQILKNVLTCQISKGTFGI